MSQNICGHGGPRNWCSVCSSAHVRVLEYRAALVYQILGDRTLDQEEARLSRLALATYAGMDDTRRAQDDISDVIAYMRWRGGLPEMLLSTTHEVNAGYWLSTDPLEGVEYLTRRQRENLSRYRGDLNGIVRPLAALLRSNGMTLDADQIEAEFLRLIESQVFAQRRLTDIRAMLPPERGNIHG
jgi:hypothetical protein